MNQRALPLLLMLMSGISLYLGAAVAVLLFDQANPILVAWLRVSTASLFLLLAVRPPLSAFRGAQGRAAMFYGLATIGMNMSFYGAIARLPLGTAVAIEFFGPVAVAAFGARGWRDWMSLCMATGGVLLLSGAQWGGNAVGVGFALLAALLWALYIVLGHRVSLADPFQGISVGFAYAAVLTSPIAIVLWPEHMSMGGMTFTGLAFALGILSALIPYSLDLKNMSIAGASYFALLNALLPLVAAVIGFLVLRQELQISELVGIAVIVAAVMVRQGGGAEATQ